MQIQPALDKAVMAASQAYEAGKSTVVWTGKMIQAGYVTYGIPALEKIQAAALAALRLIGKFLEKGPVPVFALAAGLFVAGITAFKLADQKAYEDDAFAKTVWKTVGVASFIAATAATSAGIVTVLTL